MARIAGIDLPRDKRIEIALTYIYGIGRKTATDICKATGVNPDIRVRDLTEDDASKLREYIDHTGNLTKSRDIAVRNISHVCLPVERQHVMFAKGEEIDIFHNHHLTVFFLKLGRAEHFVRVHEIAFCQTQHSLCYTFGGFQ